MESNEKDCSGCLERKGIRPTANRMLVYCAMKRSHKALSLGELEEILETVDKSSISRTLNLFLENHLLHSMEDGEGVVKYELCEGRGTCSVDDMHPHFYCEMCHRLFCLKTVHIPMVEMPDGYVVNSVNYMVKGICPDCSCKTKKPI